MVKIADAPIEINLPPMTDEEFVRFCIENPDLRIERDKDKNIIIMSPTFALTGIYEGIVYTAVFNWNAQYSNGWVFSPSAGFTLPDGAMRGADTSWLSDEKWQRLTKAEKNSFAPVCPEFVVEIRSATDSLKKIKAKMEEWIENGVQLGWLLDPANEKAWIYRADGSIEIVHSFDKTLSGENVLVDFTFDLALLLI
jgi:Uma2 family endonuclease